MERLNRRIGRRVEVSYPSSSLGGFLGATARGKPVDWNHKAMEVSLKARQKGLPERASGTLGSHQEAESLKGGCGLGTNKF